jgi:hypothetical protein
MTKEEYAQMQEQDRKLQEADAVEADKIRRCLRSEEGGLFLKRVKDQLELDLNKFKTANSIEDLKYYQGRVNAWERILAMKEE